jgi:hypothetical protein
MEIILLLVEVFGELFLESIGHLFKSRRRRNPALAFVAIVGLGCFFGWLFSVICPERLLPFMSIPGISLVIAPLLAGAVMYAFGRWRRTKDHNTTLLATFWGGAVFAFCASGVRFLIVGL